METYASAQLAYDFNIYLSFFFLLLPFFLSFLGQSMADPLGGSPGEELA